MHFKLYRGSVVLEIFFKGYLQGTYGKVEVEVETEGKVELERKGGVEMEIDGGVKVDTNGGVDSEEEVEVESEDEGHMDHLSGDEYVEEAEDVGIGLEDNVEEYRAEDSHDEAKEHGRGLSNDE
ncbi:hypothetical protein LR48_Vigan10g277900 [Vigna angularis]|uniref:Uncharacterized protein n=1 Tax=Phaseolus angularis TaxID=3914 RepID=A0A0L9VPR0_PHAAN|nr:hypothetical protein LR48_Vigan10g277900 [Vigna angularis]